MAQKKQKPQQNVVSAFYIMIFILLSLLHKVQFLLLILSKAPLVKSISDFFHHIIIEIEIMHYHKPQAQHLLCFKKMSYISSGVFLTRRTSTALFYRSHVLFMFFVEQINLTILGIRVTMTTISGRVNAIKEIYSSFHCFSYISRSTNSH